MEDSEDNVPLKELVRKELAQPENVSATETKSYEEYIMKRNERLQTNQEETVKEKSAPKGKDSIAKGKTDPKDKAILDLVDITKQHQTSGAKEGTSKRKLDITCGQSGKADPPQPGQPLDFVKRRRQVSISSDVEDVPLQQLDDEDDDYEDLGGIWENEIDYLPNTGQISEVFKSVLKLHFNAYTYCVSSTLLINYVYYVTACYATLNFSLLQEERNSNLSYIIR